MNGSDEQLAPTDILKHEHTVVLLVVDAMDREAQAIRGGAPVRADEVTKMVAFMREFTDGCHHNKEEKVLFPTLQAAQPGGQRPGHRDAGRARAGAGSTRARSPRRCRRPPRATAAAAAAVADNLAGYAELLRAHIEKENQVLFPFAERTLSADDKVRLAQEFERIEEEETGAGVHEKYHALAHELAES